ncbi:MAG: glycosyltransferase family 39 protein [Saprospiraceae bacterium]|nr:glycosyltransferase family 39 protein [Saprospiraceae bacterium]
MNSALLSRLYSSNFQKANPWFWLALGLAVVYFRGLFLDVMDVDASQYASISMEMLQNGSWLQVQHRGVDYLDKPPLLFWMSASSFGVFGLSNWAYKLPSLLAAFMGVWATYRFTLLFYGQKTARHAAFILASCMGLLVICNDVRTDTILLGFSACAVWQLAEYLELKCWRNLLAGFFFIGLAMLAKGPIGLVMPAFAAGTHLLIRRNWHGIFQWQWLLGLVVTALVLVPMCWGLWQQFDLHPEKLVNGRHDVSGLRFFFWEQSFGRITGENVWKNDTSGFYFMHVYLWAFLPWCLLLPGALWGHFRGLWYSISSTLPLLASSPTTSGEQDFHAEISARGVVGEDANNGSNSEAVTLSHRLTKREFYALGGFILTFIALSQSQYKLPHYIFITLPWAAVLVASSWKNVGKGLWGVLYFSAFFALLTAFAALFFVFPTDHVVVSGIAILITGGLLWKVFRDPFPNDTEVFVQRGTWAALIFGFVLNFHFYPALLPYQSPPQAARFARSKGIPPEKMYFFNSSSHAMDFYNGDIMENLDSPEKAKQVAQEQGGIWVFTTEAGKDILEKSDVKSEESGQFRHFQVALLKPKFLNPATRAETLGTYFLLKILPE